MASIRIASPASGNSSASSRTTLAVRCSKPSATKWAFYREEDFRRCSGRAAKQGGGREIAMRSPVLLATLLVAAGCTLAAMHENRTYTMPNGEAVRLSVPKEWVEAVTNSTSKPVVTVRFTPERSSEFIVMITFGPPEGTNNLRAKIEEAADGAIKSSGRSRIEIKELKSTDVRGYYFSVADKSPKPGEWKYLTQGIVRVGNVIGAFTILSDDKNHRGEENGLAVVQSAVYEPAGVR